MVSIARSLVSVAVLLSSVAFICCLSIGNSQIIGTQVGQFPYLVSLQTEQPWKRKVQSYCCGSILSERFVLTTVDCDSRNPIFVVVNGLNARGGQQYDTRRFIRHPGYIRGGDQLYPRPSSNNIALIEVAKPIQFSDYVVPVELERAFIQGNELSIIPGYGLTRDTLNNGLLNYAYVNTLPQYACKQAFYNRFPIEDSTLCAFARPGSGLCTTDLGGPLIRNNKLIGLSSWLPSDCTGGNPDVFTRITNYLDWIDTNTNIIYL